MLTERALINARAKAREEAIDSVIWGVLIRDNGYGEFEAVVYGGTKEREWKEARGFNEGVLTTYRAKDL